MKQEDSINAINQSHRVWKKHAPFLYSILQTYEPIASSQSIDWFADTYIESDWKISNLLIGSNSIYQNSLQIVSVGLPTEDSLTDYSVYQEGKPSVGVGANGYIGTMGQQEMTLKVNIPQSSLIMRARINRFDENYIAVKAGGANTEFIIYDLRNKEDQLENNCIRLEGHSQQGFGLCWSPHKVSKLLSGSYDSKILLYNIQQGEIAQSQWMCGSGVQDVQWSYSNENIIASSHTDEKINLWDIRSSDQKPFITRKAHKGAVFCLDFNRKSQFLLLSGGEDGDVNLWDVRNMSRIMHEFVGHNDAVNAVKWSPHNANHFASGSDDRRTVVWDVEKLTENTAQKSGNEISFIHSGHRSAVSDVCWNTQSSLLSSCQQSNNLHIWQPSQSALSH